MIKRIPGSVLLALIASSACGGAAGGPNLILKEPESSISEVCVSNCSEIYGNCRVGTTQLFRDATGEKSWSTEPTIAEYAQWVGANLKGYQGSDKFISANGWESYLDHRVPLNTEFAICAPNFGGSDAPDSSASDNEVFEELKTTKVDAGIPTAPRPCANGEQCISSQRAMQTFRETAETLALFYDDVTAEQIIQKSGWEGYENEPLDDGVSYYFNF